MSPEDTWTPEQQKAERAAVRERVLEGLAIVAVVLVLICVSVAVSGRP